MSSAQRLGEQPWVPYSDDCRTCSIGLATAPGPCAFRPLTVKAGTLILLQGEIAEHVWLLKRGIVLASSVDEAGEEMSCGVRGPGALLGLESLIGRPSAFDAWAVDELEMCRLDRAGVERWLGKRDSPMGVVLGHAIAEAALRHDERTAVSGGATLRVARFLLTRAQMAKNDEPLRLKNQHLARMLAMRAETLSRVLAKLRAAGALADGRIIRVASRARLAELAAAEMDGE